MDLTMHGLYTVQEIFSATMLLQFILGQCM